MRHISATTLLFVALVLFAGNAYAQTTSGSISGLVNDASNAVIPGVTVTATNTDTGVSANVLSNESGAYNFVGIPPGVYKVTAELPGFRPAVFNRVQLGTSATVRLDIKLEVGASTRSVEVTVASDTILREAGASIGEVLPSERIHDLPLVGNDVLQLVRVLPGFRADQFGAAFDTMGGVSVSTVNTVRDGLSVSDGRNNNGIFATTTINPDMVEEIRLILSPVDAELGRGNGQVQIQTRSGTNRYTGSAVWNARNTGLNANTWARNNDIVAGVWTPTKPDWKNENQYTISYGGPLRKNKTFFFVLWDHNLSRTRALVSNTVLTDAARNGVFRYFDNWNSGNAGTTVPVIPANLTTGTYPVIDYSGNPVRPPQNPDGSAYTGGLRCFSVFGPSLLDGSSITAGPAAANDKYCPGGTWMTNGASAWDSSRTAFDSTGYIQKILTAMPLPNFFGPGGTAIDGLNQGVFRWVRGRTGVASAAGTDTSVNRKQINVKIDQNFNARNRLSVSWSYERDDGGDNIASWPGGFNGETFRRPQVLTANFTSTLSPTLVNEARFGIRYNKSRTNPAYESDNAQVRESAREFLLSGGQNANGTVYPVAFTPGAGNYSFGNSVISNGATYSGNTTPLYNYADTISLTHGKHAFKMGVELRLPRTNGYNLNPYPMATGGAGATGSNLANAIAGLPNMLATARGNAANMLYFLYGGVNGVTQQYWVDSPSDITNATWQDIATKTQRFRNQVSTEWSLFWKDDWKARKNLTLNLGLRYDYFSSPYLDSGYTSTAVGQGGGLFGISRSSGELFDNWLAPGNVFLSGYGPNVPAASALLCSNTVAAQPGLPTPNCDPNKLTILEFVGPGSPNPDKTALPVDRNNWGPAIGFSWNVPWFGEGKTTVRGGYQVTFTNGAVGTTLDGVLGSGPGNTNNATLNLSDFSAITNTRALNLTDLPLLVPVKPTLTPGGTVPIYGRTIGFTAYDPDFRTPYVENFTLSITRNVVKQVTLDVRYIGNFAKKQPGTVNLNTPNVYYNQELKDALDITRAGGNAPLFDQMFAGLNLNNNVTGYAAVGSAAAQTGSAHLRRVAAANLANGNYLGVVNTILGLSPTGLLTTPATGTVNGGGRTIRNGCDRLANGQSLVSAAIPTPLRCFPENYLIANPQFSTATYSTALRTSNYHSLQTQVTLRPVQGISFQSTYIWAKSLGNGDQVVGFTGHLDPLNRAADYELLVSDVRHDFRTNGTFELPLGPNKLLLGNSAGWLARVVEKWQTSLIWTANSGNPRSIMAAQTQYFINTNNGTPQPTADIVGPWVNPTGHVEWNGPNNATGTYFGASNPYIRIADPQCSNGQVGTGTADALGFDLRTSCTLTALAQRNPDGSVGQLLLQNPLPGKRGTLGMQTVTAPGRWSLDANIAKSFKIDESKTLQLRIDTTNVLNHAQIAPTDPGLCMQSGGGACAQDFGVVPGKGGSARTFQGQVRLSF